MNVSRFENAEEVELHSLKVQGMTGAENKCIRRPKIVNTPNEERRKKGKGRRRHSRIDCSEVKLNFLFARNKRKRLSSIYLARGCIIEKIQNFGGTAFVSLIEVESTK